MCGIAGVYRLGGRSPSEAEREADRTLVARMLERLVHRGPDDRGIESAGRATLGVRRLAILDVEGGHQPLSDPEGRVWAIQNGELYNYPALRSDLERRHALRTRTDTEVLPLLYLERGTRCVEALNGMFALAIHDRAADSLLLARDPLGVKPLYLAEVGGRLLFASEMQALLCDPAVPRELDLDAVSRFLALGWTPGSATAFRAIRKLRPGVRLLVTPRGGSEERFWQWPSFAGRSGAPAASLERLADEAERRLAASVGSMLLSDRPLGVLLSGGLDSSVLTALLPEDVRRETRTFAIGFEAGGHHDERRHARRVASHLGTRHSESVVPLDLEATFPRVVEMLDEPCADPAAVPAHLVAREAAREVTVLLSGTGGDEVFGGYRRYRLGRLLPWTRWLPRGAARGMARALGDRNQHRGTATAERLVMARKLLEARSRPGFLEGYLSTFEPAPPARWAEALAVDARPADVARALRVELRAETSAPAGGAEAMAFTFDHLFYLPDDLLLKEDRTTMGASVEGRVPYLDTGLVAYAASLPLASRFDGPRGKRLLRLIARRHLPADIAARPKHGFSVPIEDWLRGPLSSLAGDTFSGDGSGVFRMPVLRRWHDEHRAGKDRSGALWAALCFEVWWQRVGNRAPEGSSTGPGPAAGREGRSP